GILTYILLGETSIGRRRVSRLHAVLATMPDLTKAPGMNLPNLQPKIPENSMQTALCASARRGVTTTVIFPRAKRLVDRGCCQPQLLVTSGNRCTAAHLSFAVEISADRSRDRPRSSDCRDR